MIMKTKREQSNWTLLDIVVVIIAWGIAIALIYLVIMKVRILINL